MDLMETGVRTGHCLCGDIVLYVSGPMADVLHDEGSNVDSLTGNRTGLVLLVVLVAFLITVVIAVILLAKLLARFKPVHDQLTPFGAKAAFWGALAYTFLPIHLLPDPILLDDIGLLAFALFYINRIIGGGTSDTDGGISP